MQHDMPFGATTDSTSLSLGSPPRILLYLLLHLLILSQLVSELFSSCVFLAHYSPSRVTVVRERHVSHSFVVHDPEDGKVVLDHVAALNANQHRGLAVAVRLPDVCKRTQISSCWKEYGV
jgi:hypothetical protein